MIVSDAEFALEDFLVDKGVPTFCRQAQSTEGEPYFELVVPQDQEMEVFSALKSLPRELRDFRSADLRVRTILFHLAYERFRNLDLPLGVLLSVNVENLRAPIKFELANHRSGFGYDLRLVLVGLIPQPGRLQMFAPPLLGAVSEFNHEARYLKVVDVKLGATPSTFVPQGGISFEQVWSGSP